MKFIVALLLIFVSGLAWAAQNGGFQPDPYIFNDAVNVPFNVDTTTKTLSSQTLNVSQRTLILLDDGQSNMTDVGSTAYTPTNASAIDNFDIYNGAIYRATDPLVGTQISFLIGANVCLRVADQLIALGLFDRVIIVPVAVGGTTVSQWGTGGQLANRVQTAMLRLAQRGITPSTINTTWAILWGQGENDTVAGTTQTAYATAFNSMVANIQAAGFTGRIFVAKETYDNGSFSTAVQAAQTNTTGSNGVINNAGGVYAGVNADALVGNICNGTNACRRADNTHFTDAGLVNYANGWTAAMQASGSPY